MICILSMIYCILSTYVTYTINPYVIWTWKIICYLYISYVVYIDYCYLMVCIRSQAGPRSAVGNVSGYRCVSDCISRGREFDPGPVPYFRGDWSWNNFYGHSPPFRWSIQEGLLSVTSESMCTNYWLTACSSLPRKECRKVNWPSRNDHSCWQGT